VQEAGYRVRIRIDPVIPFDGWKGEYSRTIRRIFEKISPESVTIGTLRFEKEFYNCRKALFTKGCDLPILLESMEPMFPAKKIQSSGKTKSGKYSFVEGKRVEIFKSVIKEIRKYSDCPVALCKESSTVWDRVGLTLSECSCVCQLCPVDMSSDRA
jgi:spore photoproduct lyase